MKYKSVTSIALFILILVLSSLACASFGAEPTAIPPTATKTVKPTATPQPSRTPRPSPTPDKAATQVMEETQARVDDYFSKGYLPSTEGELFNLDDFKEELAQIGYLSDPYGTGYDKVAQNFVFRADFKWENAAKNPETSGCGFYYRFQEDGSHYFAYLDTERVVVGGYAPSQGNYVKRFGVTKGKGVVDFGNPAEASFTFIMNGYMGYALVNDEFIGSYTMYTKDVLDPGYIAYFLKSGTNKDYGTRCEISNASLWVAK